MVRVMVRFVKRCLCVKISFVVLDLKEILGRKYYPLNRIEIIRENIIGNYQYLSSLDRDIKIAPVLKSNAYGHGIELVAKILDDYNPPFFCVDSLFEAYEILKIEVKTKILVMGFCDPRNLMVKKLPFSFAVYDFKHMEEILKYQPQAGIHVFVDTGMHREGVRIEALVGFIKKMGKVNIEGLMSHFAMSEKHDSPLTLMQVKNFKRARGVLEKFGINPKWVHLGASGGFLNAKRFGDIGNMARCGKAIYGIDLSGKYAKLKLALRLKSKIVQIKELNKGERVGYDFTYKAKKKMKIGILPIGYNDGVDRRLSNLGFVKIDGVFCPINGRVSMNITTVDLSKVKGAFVGQEVVVISEVRGDLNSAENIAKTIGTIPHDVLVGLSGEIKREVV